MKILRKLSFCCLTIILLVTLCSCSTSNHSFKYWKKDAESLQTIIDYVKDVTNKNSANYIPEEDRIAVFDMDGTLCGEESPTYIETILLIHRILDDPTYSASEEFKNYANYLKETAFNGLEYDEPEFSRYAGLAYKGMTINEYEKFVQDYTNNNLCKGYENLTYANSFFLPMIEVVDYLNDNGFSTYICSGTDRSICRTLLKNHVNIKQDHIIGRDIALIPNDYNGSSNDSYEYEYDNTLVRSDELVSICWEGNKVYRIASEIGKQPVMVFGNSLGDTSMAVYATDDNPYKSIAIMIMNDDTEREHGKIDKYNKRKIIWDDYGWTTVSMKNDWLTIYGFDIVKKD